MPHHMLIAVLLHPLDHQCEAKFLEAADDIYGKHREEATVEAQDLQSLFADRISVSDFIGILRYSAATDNEHLEMREPNSTNNIHCRNCTNDGQQSPLIVKVQVHNSRKLLETFQSLHSLGVQNFFICHNSKSSKHLNNYIKDSNISDINISYSNCSPDEDNCRENLATGEEKKLVQSLLEGYVIEKLLPIISTENRWIIETLKKYSESASVDILHPVELDEATPLQKPFETLLAKRLRGRNTKNCCPSSSWASTGRATVQLFNNQRLPARKYGSGVFTTM